MGPPCMRHRVHGTEDLILFPPRRRLAARRFGCGLSFGCDHHGPPQAAIADCDQSEENHIRAVLSRVGGATRWAMLEYRKSTPSGEGGQWGAFATGRSAHLD